MCRRVECGKCKKPTWAGCGQHIESALAGKNFFCLLFIMILENIIKVLIILGVPENERCKCEKK
jgi:hypothetical protein